ncbi:tyrosine-type recombinase/integrase [Acetobacter farinalis]|uniref:Tyrosine-type recombinase/integrase n=1 Tax=Acetobacter farinalis TaxID=1260984 RepID=A0ABT3Q9W2_9PROT|nr:tyrosine-type recombinase/integrase [Acetobacter farinalis]MCX2562036.1 tyrosine-type recombinase/integrase [Acetobacter farinalis]NHO30641.1 tyrosine-type recombinase/integrase [Acetobacter farinalis]
MLRVVGTRYHFRRAIPRDIQAILGRKEFSLSLKTSNKVVARERAGLLYGRIGELFTKAKDFVAVEPDKADWKDLADLQAKIIAEHEALRDVERAASQSRRKADAARHLYEKLALVKQTEDFFERVTPAMHDLLQRLSKLNTDILVDTKVSNAEKQGFRDQIANLTHIITSLNKTEQPEIIETSQDDTPAKKDTKKRDIRPRLSEMAERFVFSDPTKSADTIKGTTNSIALFTEAFGDMPVADVTGKIAGEFRDLLSGLPAMHGKGKSNPPIREAVEQAAELELETVSGKTVKNHFSRMSALWRHLVQRDYAPRNPFEKWQFDITKKVERRAWSEQELEQLVSAPWTGRSISKKTYEGLVQVALYTGMRLGEICNLRNKDIEVIDGVPCFHIQPYVEIVNGKKREWSPKTAAGTRIIPIHSKLIAAGIMDFKNSDTYFFDELTIAPHGVRGSDFAQAFSKFKRRMGIPEDVSFHSFRHLVSTKLRNQENDIRELWIDALLGHEATHRSQGTTNYMSGIEIKNLQRVVEALVYPSFLQFPHTL